MNIHREFFGLLKHLRDFENWYKSSFYKIETKNFLYFFFYYFSNAKKKNQTHHRHTERKRRKKRKRSIAHEDRETMSLDDTTTTGNEVERSKRTHVCVYMCVGSGEHRK